jgi:hypothetical protein
MSPKTTDLKDTIRPFSAIAVCALGLALLAGNAQAKHPVEIYFDGAWCQRTAGQGTDTVSVATNATIYPANGFFDPNDTQNSHTVNTPLGTYNDRGGSARQEMKHTSLMGFVLEQGQSADVVVAMYGNSNGGFLDHLGGALKGAAPTIIGAVVTAYGSPVAGAAVKVVSDKTISAVSSAFQSADPGSYVGDIKIHIENDQNDHVTFTMLPNTHANDRHHVNPPRNSESFQLNGPRAEYWPKLIVLIH